MAVFQLVLIQGIHEHLHHINIKMNAMILKYHLSFILFLLLDFIGLNVHYILNFLINQNNLK